MKVIKILCIFLTCCIGRSSGQIASETQLKGPDVLELSSEGNKDLTQPANKNIKALFEKAENLSAKATKKLNAILMAYEEFNKKFEALNTKIDKFLQEASFSKGKAKENAPKETLDLINTCMINIKKLKKSLKDQIKEFDQKKPEALSAAAPMHKDSLKILSTRQEGDAQTIVNNISNELGKITTIQSFITGDFTTTYNNTIAKIEELLKQGEAAVKKLIQQQPETP